MKRFAIVIGLLLAFMSSAFAQQVVKPCTMNVSGGCVPVTGAFPLPVTGDTEVSTYSAAIAGQSNSSSSDLACINGSTTKKVHVKNIRVSAIASAGVVVDVSIVKRSTADVCSGGCTPTTLTAVPHTSSNPAGTAVVTAYSSATGQTPGTAVGTIRAQKLAIATVTTPATAQTPMFFNFAEYYAQDIELNGTAQGLCVVVPATAGGSWDFNFTWTEQ